MNGFYICMLFYQYFDCITQINDENALILIKRDFLIIEKISPQQEKAVFPIPKKKISSRKTQKFTHLQS